MRRADPTLPIQRDAEIARVRDVVGSVLRGFLQSAASSRLTVFPERLLALRHVEGLARPVGEIQITPGTVITPLARDELKRRGIVVRWVSRREVETVRQTGEWGFVIDGDLGVLLALRRTWLDEPHPWRELSAPGDAARWVAEAPERGAIVVTDEGALAAWRANQVAGVRATCVESGASLLRAIETLGLNLLVVEPAGKPLPLLKQLATTFRSAGAPRVPTTLFAEAAPCVSPR